MASVLKDERTFRDDRSICPRRPDSRHPAPRLLPTGRVGANFVETTRPGTAAAKNARARPVSGTQHREPLALVLGQGFRGHSRLHDHPIDFRNGRNHVRRGGIQLFG